MAVIPDPIGAYNQTFQTADTSRRDWERLDLLRQQQAEAAVQRARENKANDFKMMMMALGRQDDLKQQEIDNKFKAAQLANQTLTAQASDYRARNPLSRSGRGMLDLSPPGVTRMPSATPVDPNPAYSASLGIPPMDGGNVAGPAANDASLDMPMGGSANQPNLLLPEMAPTTAATGSPPDLAVGEMMPPPQMPADNTPPAAPEPPNLSITTSAQFPSTPSTYNSALLAPLAPAMAVPAAAAPAQAPPRMPSTPTAMPKANGMMEWGMDQIGYPRAERMPEIPVFGQADLASQGRQQLKQLASLQEEAQMARAQAPRNIAKATSLLSSGRLNPERIPEWTDYIQQQDRIAVASARAEGEAAQQLLQTKEDLKGIQLRQGALNKLGGLNGVLPPEERKQIYDEASDPATGQLAEQKIAVLTEYNAFRQLQGITNASRGYRTAEQVVTAARELQKPEAIKDRDLVDNAQAYRAALKANPGMDTKAREKLELEIGEANAAQIRQNARVTRLNKAMEADTLKPAKGKEPVKPDEIRVNPATPAAPVRDISLPMSASEKKAAEDKAGSNFVWGELKRQASPVVTRMDDRTLEAIVSGRTDGVADNSRGLGVSGGFGMAGAVTPSGPRVSQTMAATYLKDLKLPKGYDVPAHSGRKTPLTAEDALIAAAKDELERRNPKGPKVSDQGRSLADKIRAAAEGGK